jgi:hypothetical protein
MAPKMTKSHGLLFVFIMNFSPDGISMAICPGQKHVSSLAGYFKLFVGGKKTPLLMNSKTTSSL